MTVREAVDAALKETLHRLSTQPDYPTWAQRGTLFLQQGVEYVWDFDDWDFKYKTGSLTVTANTGRVEAPTDMSIEGPHGGFYISGQRREIEWIPGRELFAIRELEARSGDYPEYYTVQEQTTDFRPFLYFDRSTHLGFTGTLYYLRTRPDLLYVTAPGAATSALAGAGAGLLSNGAYTYKVTFVTATGETEGGTTSNTTTVTDFSVNGKINLTAIPVSTVSGVTSRKLYRTVAGGSQHKLLATLSDNTTTTYQDNIADASLGANVPTTDTSGDDLKKIPQEYHRGVLLEWLRYALRENVGDQKAEANNFPLFTTALARMRTQRVYGLHEVNRFGDSGIRNYQMW